MRFEFDPKKSAANAQKHGIDFEACQVIWSDPRMIEAPARTVDEPRFVVVGQIGGKHWTVVITYRGNVCRIISARRSRQEEVYHYESQ